MSQQFCPKCGSEIGLIAVPAKERIEFDIYDEFDDRLNEIAQHYGDMDEEIYISNKNNLGSGKDYESYERNIIQIFPDEIPGALEKMKTDFEKEISRLKEVFGENNVNIQFGVINYAF